MTGEIVNLRRARKAKARADSASEAAANRAKFGRSRLELEQSETAALAAIRHLDGHRLNKGNAGQATEEAVPAYPDHADP